MIRFGSDVEFQFGVDDVKGMRRMYVAGALLGPERRVQQDDILDISLWSARMSDKILNRDGHEAQWKQ